jgi:hypothetical protein
MSERRKMAIITMNPTSLLDELRELRQSLLERQRSEAEYASLLESYATLMEIAMMGLETPLPDDCVLPDDLMPPGLGYAAYKQALVDYGKPTFSKFLHDCELVALIRVSKRLKSDRAKCVVIEQFKGPRQDEMTVYFTGRWIDLVERRSYLICPSQADGLGWGVTQWSVSHAARGRSGRHLCHRRAPLGRILGRSPDCRTR